MVTGMQFKKKYESHIEYLRKSFTKEKKEKKIVNDFFIAVLLHFYDLNYLNSTKIRLSNEKWGMVSKVTLIYNSKMDTVTQFQISILKMIKKLPPPM